MSGEAVWQTRKQSRVITRPKNHCIGATSDVRAVGLHTCRIVWSVWRYEKKGRSSKNGSATSAYNLRFCGAFSSQPIPDAFSTFGDLTDVIDCSNFTATMQSNGFVLHKSIEEHSLITVLSAAALGRNMCATHNRTFPRRIQRETVN